MSNGPKGHEQHELANRHLRHIDLKGNKMNLTTFTFKNHSAFMFGLYILQFFGLLTGFTHELAWVWALLPFWLVGIFYFLALTMLTVKLALR